jgi:hypothetical protein
MKKLLSILVLILVIFSSTTNCKKEKIVYKYIESDSGKIYLLGVRTLFVNDTTARVVIEYIDTDSTTTTQYTNTLFNIETAQQEQQITDVTQKAVYDNVKLRDYYRHTTIATPSNQRLNVVFRIGTMGDVYIQNE